MLGIIGAMELEVAELKSKTDVKNVVEKAGMKFHEGILNGKDVVIVQCGIGKVNAGMCVQILADLFNVDAVINTGVAGSRLAMSRALFRRWKLRFLKRTERLHSRQKRYARKLIRKLMYTRDVLSAVTDSFRTGIQKTG